MTITKCDRCGEVVDGYRSGSNIELGHGLCGDVNVWLKKGDELNIADLCASCFAVVMKEITDAVAPKVDVSG